MPFPEIYEDADAFAKPGERYPAKAPLRPEDIPAGVDEAPQGAGAGEVTQLVQLSVMS